jgi:hypothetical protein
MSNVTISQLPGAGPITGAELVPIVQGGATVQTTVGAIAAAPAQQQSFLTVNSEPTLPGSRYLAVTGPLTLADGGAQRQLVVGLGGAPASLQAAANGIQVKTGANTLAPVQIAVSGGGLTIANADGTTGNPTIALTGVVSNLASQSGTGLLAISGSTLTPVSLQPVTNQTVVYNADGAAPGPSVGFADNPSLPGTGGVLVPGGTTAQRPASPSNGTLRYNSTSGLFEGYAGDLWASFSLSTAVNSFSAGNTGLTPNSPTTGSIVLGGVLNASSGGTGVGGTLTGYVFANGTGAMTASATVPTTALSGTVSNSQLANSSITVNGSLISLGSTATITASTPNALNAGTGLSGGSYTGAAAATFAIANTTVTAGSYGAPASVGTFTVNAQGQLTAASAVAIALPSSQITDKGLANGVASLNSSGVVPLAQLPSSLSGAVNYVGTWNASTNTPTLSSGIGTKGQYYVVSTAGTTTLDGTSLWSVGDWAVFNGSVWEKINGSSSEAFAAITVTGLSGLMYANATSPVTAATASQIVSAIGATPVQNATNATNATTATNTVNVGLAAGSAATNYITFSAAATGNNPLLTSTSLTYNASTGALTAGVAGGSF